MTNNTALSKFIKYVSVNILGMIAISCYILADTFFVTKGLGENGLAALNIAISFYGFMHGAGLLIGIGGATRYAILFAQGEKERAAKVFSQSVFIGLIISAVFVIIGGFLSDPLCRLLGANDVTFDMTKTYLQTILLFSPFFIINNILISFIRNDKSPNLAMLGMIAGSFLNIALDYVFIFPCKMGMFGAAFATGLAPIFSIMLLSIHFFKKKNNLKMTRCGITLSTVKVVFLGGISSFIVEISSAIALIVFNLTMLRLGGNTAVAAYGIVANLSLVCVAMFVGLAQGIQPIVSSAYGIKKHSEVKAVLRYALIFSLIMSVIIYAVIYVFSDPLIAIFNVENNNVLRDYAIVGLRVYFIGFLFAGINIPLCAFFSATARANKGFFVSITRGIIALVPLVIAMSYAFSMVGVWLAFVLAEAITATLAIIFLVKSRENIAD